MKKPIKIAVFASGSGSNAENLINHFKRSSLARVAMVVCNNPKAGVIERAQRLRVPLVLISKRSLESPTLLIDTLKDNGIELICLAGFMQLIPSELVDQYPRTILNIHPALLPEYGGKGMFGKNVHNAVVRAGETVSGITVHLVNSEYDKGQILEQYEVKLEKEDRAEDVELKVRELEIMHYPKVVEEYVKLMFE